MEQYGLGPVKKDGVVQEDKRNNEVTVLLFSGTSLSHLSLVEFSSCIWHQTEEAALKMTLLSDGVAADSFLLTYIH